MSYDFAGESYDFASKSYEFASKCWIDGKAPKKMVRYPHRLGDTVIQSHQAESSSINDEKRNHSTFYSSVIAL